MASNDDMHRLFGSYAFDKTNSFVKIYMQRKLISPKYSTFCPTVRSASKFATNINRVMEAVYRLPDSTFLDYWLQAAESFTFK